MSKALVRRKAEDYLPGPDWSRIKYTDSNVGWVRFETILCDFPTPVLIKLNGNIKQDSKQIYYFSSMENYTATGSAEILRNAKGTCFVWITVQPKFPRRLFEGEPKFYAEDEVNILEEGTPLIIYEELEVQSDERNFTPLSHANIGDENQEILCVAKCDGRDRVELKEGLQSVRFQLFNRRLYDYNLILISKGLKKVII